MQRGNSTSFRMRFFPSFTYHEPPKNKNIQAQFTDAEWDLNE